MIKKLTVLILACSVLLVHLTPLPVQGQDAIADAKREKVQIEKEIRSIESRIGRTDSLMRVESERFSLLEQRLSDGIVRKKRDTDTLNAKLEELTAEVTRLSGSIEQQRAGIRALATRREYINGQLVEQCDNLSTQIRSSLPWNRDERISRVNALKSDLQSGSAQIEDGLSRLMALIEEEITFSDEIVLDSRTIRRNDGSTANARVLRIGNLWMVYVDASEQFYGVLHRENDTSFVWTEDLDFTQREQIRTAIRVKESKKAPQIISLPLETAVTRGEEDR
jgi:hypothetical protein